MNVVAFRADKEDGHPARGRGARPAAMGATDFDAWLKHLGFSERHAARVLQVGRATIARYRREGAPAHIGYACTAIALGMPIWQKAE
ncbi:hypothetical protein [Nitratireductor sp. OM-1]|uniref:hypothetical protein n=1 Tax=Nitratireductor TaxID=245876 RepID=UPI000DDF6942|nr:hypothetical protein [Nitratireductor sp. OM-1]